MNPSSVQVRGANATTQAAELLAAENRALRRELSRLQGVPPDEVRCLSLGCMHARMHVPSLMG